MVCFTLFSSFISTFLPLKGLSDPYCELNIVNNSSTSNGADRPATTLPSAFPGNSLKRSLSLFSCARSSCTTIRNNFHLSSLVLALESKLKSLPSLFNPRSSEERLSVSRSSNNDRTEIRPKTINPEWNEHFEL